MTTLLRHCRGKLDLSGYMSEGVDGETMLNGIRRGL